MVAGVLVGHFLPAVPRFLDRLQIDGISIPIAILIWIMIYPMMIKVDFQSIREVGRHPKGLFVTWITNWLIKPFTMYALAAFFFFHVFQAFIPQDLATQYLAGAVLLGAAPCTAMVFVWSTLTKGDPAYTVVQVATNDLIILAAFVPIVKFLLGVSHVTVPYSVLFLSIFLFVVIPLAGGILTRMTVIRQKGEAYFNQVFIHKFDQATTWAAADPGDHLQLPGPGNPVQSLPYPPDRHSPGAPDLSDLCHRLRGQQPAPSAPQHRSPGR